jgi:hypothetical protein
MSQELTREERILHLLQAAWPNWVPAPELAKISLQYSARIFFLRKHFVISNKVEIRNGTKCGCFRLGPPPVPRSQVIRQQKKAVVEQSAPQSLFGDDLPESFPEYPD